MSQTLHSGLLVALEGIDGAGKSTQARRLRQALAQRGFDVVIFKEPGDSDHGREIRNLLVEGRKISPEEEARLFLEDRRIDVRDNIKPALTAGSIVIMDRYYFSSMAYQGALGLDPQEIRAANELFAPRPHLTVILDVASVLGVERIRCGRGSQDCFEAADYLTKVRQLFLSFCNHEVVCVDGSGPEPSVHASILQHVLEVVRCRGDRAGFSTPATNEDLP